MLRERLHYVRLLTLLCFWALRIEQFTFEILVWIENGMLSARGYLGKVARLGADFTT